jgi:hypothetical protein
MVKLHQDYADYNSLMLAVALQSLQNNVLTTAQCVAAGVAWVKW